MSLLLVLARGGGFDFPIHRREEDIPRLTEKLHWRAYYPFIFESSLIIEGRSSTLHIEVASAPHEIFLIQDEIHNDDPFRFIAQLHHGKDRGQDGDF